MNILDELYYIFEENKDSKVENALWKKVRAELNIIPEHSIENITNLIHEYARECEKSGFSNGFIYGIQLMLECTAKSTASND